MKIRSGTIGKGTLPVLAAAFLCTGTQAQIGAYTCEASHPLTATTGFLRSNNNFTTITNTNPTCTLPVQMSHWFDLSADVDLMGSYATLKCVDFSMWGTTNVGDQLITVSVFQDITPLSSASGVGTSCEGQVAGYDGTMEPGPDLGNAILLGSDEVFIAAGINPGSGPRPDGDFSVELTGPRGGGILLSPDIAYFVVFGHAGEALTQFGGNNGGEAGDITGGAFGGPEQTWVRPFNCSVGGLCSQTGDWQKALLYYAGNLDIVMQVILDLNDTREPEQLAFDCREDIEPFTVDEVTGEAIIVGNRVVNVLDLLAMLAGWGGIAPPRPVGDIFPCPTPGVDCPGDNQTNVLDLLALLAAWGDCPNLVEDCDTALLEGNVTAQVGEGTHTWTIQEGLIETDVHRASSDDITAVVLAGGVGFCGWADYTTANGLINGTGTALNTIWGDTFGIFMGNINAGPGTEDPIIVGGDVWFQYTSTCNGRVFISATSDCEVGVAVSDTILEVYPGDVCPSDWTEVLHCNDSDLDPAGCGDFGAVDFIVLDGDEFLVRIAGWLGETGSGSLNINCIDNSECDASLEVLVNGDAVTGNTFDAGIANEISCPNTQTTGGRWFKVIGTGNVLTASTCQTEAIEIAAGLNSLFDSVISVYCGTDNEVCADLTCIASSNDDTCNFHQEVSWCSAAGQEYYILIHGTDIVPGPPFTNEGFFILDVTQGLTPCGGALNCGVDRPVNDLCANAIVIPYTLPDEFGESISETGVGTLPGDQDSNVNAATDGPNVAGCNGISNDVWYSYTPNFTSSVTVGTCGSTATPVTEFDIANFDTIIEVYLASAADCPPADITGLLACQDDTAGCPGATQITAAFDVFAGQEILIRVGADGGTKEGTFTLRVTAISTLSLCAETPVLEDFCPVGGIAEGGGLSEPLIVDGGQDVTNGGCNMCPTRLFDTIVPSLAVLPSADPQPDPVIICGQISTYVADFDLDCGASPVSAARRDTDWYTLEIPAMVDEFGITSLGASVALTFSSEFSANFGITEAVCAVTPGLETPAVVSGVNGGLCTEQTLNAFLDAGTYYLFVTSSAFAGTAVGGSHEGHDYIVEIAPLTPGIPPPTANDECETAIVVSSNSTTQADNREATENADSDPIACDNGSISNNPGSPRTQASYGTIWYVFEATTTTATVTLCNEVFGIDGDGGVDGNLVVWQAGAVSACDFGVDVGCGEDDCGIFALNPVADLVDLLVGEDYYIMMGGWWTGDYNVYSLDITSP